MTQKLQFLNAEALDKVPEELRESFARSPDLYRAIARTVDAFNQQAIESGAPQVHPIEVITAFGNYIASHLIMSVASNHLSDASKTPYTQEFLSKGASETIKVLSDILLNRAKDESINRTFLRQLIAFHEEKPGTLQ